MLRKYQISDGSPMTPYESGVYGLRRRCQIKDRIRRPVSVICYLSSVICIAAFCPAYSAEGYNEWDNVEITRGPREEIIVRAKAPDDVFVPPEVTPSPVYEVAVSSVWKKK